MCILQATGVNTACILLHYVDGVLKDIAVATIINLVIRVMHYRLIPEGLLRVTLCLIKPGYDDVFPPIQPMQSGDEDEGQEPRALRNCHG
jgi:hypothetical protein